MGCRGKYSIAGLRPCWSAHAVMPMQPSDQGSSLPLWPSQDCPGRAHLTHIGDGRAAAPIRVTM
jgi:hypothetical protein